MRLNIVKNLYIIIPFILAGCILPAAPDPTKDENEEGGSSAPEISISVNSVAYAHNSTFDFGSIPLDSSIAKVFTITNTGSAVLSLTGDTIVLFSGSDTGMFQLSSQPSSSIAIDGTTTFIITYAPTGAESVKSASIIILNSDSDEGSYKINLTGTTPAAPTGSTDAEIGVDVSDVIIINNGTFDFGGNEVGSTIVKTFTISNSGSGVLGVTGTPEVTTGDASMFTVSAPLSPTVAIDSFTTFTVTYVPTGEAGLKTTTLTIVNSDNSSFLITLTDTSTFTVSKVLLTGDSNYVNDVGISLTATVANAYDVADTTFTGNIELDAGDFDISPSQLTITTDGTATANFTITKDRNFYDTNTDISATYTSLTSSNKTVIIPAVLEGTEITAGDLLNGYTIAVGTYHIAPRISSDPAININDDIVINGGKLIIYPGNTLNFDSDSQISVLGALEVYGTDDQRVKLTGTNWDGIIAGNTNGTSTLVMDGVFIEQTDTYPISIGSSSTRSFNTTITNSRIKVDVTNREALNISGPKSGGTYTFENNVIIADNQEAFYIYYSDGSITVNIRNNTIIHKSSSTISINMYENISGSIVTIENNIISGNITQVIYFNNANLFIYYNNNVINTTSSFGSYLDAPVANVSESENLYIDGSSSDTLTIVWDDSIVFENSVLGDYHLKQTAEYPVSADASSWTNMVGSLSVGHDNEKGAYANGGYPPEHND